jgi:hypothetical protein
MPGVFQRGHEIFVALAFEPCLRGFEACNAGGDFFPLQSGVVWLFGHAHPFDSCSTAIGGCDWGVNWEEALQDCDGRASTSRWIRHPPSL